jgi:hypothetical protein
LCTWQTALSLFDNLLGQFHQSVAHVGTRYFREGVQHGDGIEAGQQIGHHWTRDIGGGKRFAVLKEAPAR